MKGFNLRCNVAIAAILLSSSAIASEEHGGGEVNQLKAIVSEIMKDNTAFVKSHKPAYFSSFAEKQHPRATVVTCSDSRVHAHALNSSPDGDLFMVRNIGNQVGTAEGSVEYGVHHLHTPLLIIVGHVACGAIKAAKSDYSGESAAIRRELDTIKLPQPNPTNGDEQEVLRGVDANVNNQVAFALKKFAQEVKEGKLTVIGTIYDFQNAMHQGYGKLVVTNFNGNTDTANVLSGIGKLTAVASAGSHSKPDSHAAAGHGTTDKAASTRLASVKIKTVVKKDSTKASAQPHSEVKAAAKLEDVFNYKSSTSTSSSGAPSVH